MKRLALIVVAAFVVAGCAGSHGSSSALRQHDRLQYPAVIHSPVVHAALLPRFQDTQPPHPHTMVHPFWNRGLIVIQSQATLLSPTRLQIVTLGRGSCPSVPDELVVENAHTIRIHLSPGSRLDGKMVAHPPRSGVCTVADFGIGPMVVAIDPKVIDVRHRLTVQFVYKDSKKPEVRTAAPLPSYPAVIHLPHVALANKPLPFRDLPRLVSPTRLEIATWGSYTCPGVPYEIAVTNPHSISISVGQGVKTLHGIAARKPGGCTLDLRLDRILVAIDPKLVDVHHPLTIHGLSPLHFTYGMKHPKPYVPTIAPLSR